MTQEKFPQQFKIAPSTLYFLLFNLSLVEVFPIRGLRRKFCELMQLMDNFPTLILPFSVPSLLTA